MTVPEALPPAQWLRSAAPAWLGSSTSTGSTRMRRFESFSGAVSTLLESSVTSQADATKVIDELGPTLGQCDSLTFESTAECLAYVCWHLVDRYGRVQHALDHLTIAGHLPIRRRPVTLLEIGAGPAPAAYAIADYYASLAEWCEETNQTIRPTRLGVPATLDRGAAWGYLVHLLSESVLMQGQDVDRIARTFSTSYADLRGFSVRRLHHEGIAQAAAQVKLEAEWADEYLDVPEARELAMVRGTHPPSAYDLIVMCNFLTQSKMTDELASELSGLTGALTPGGVLLVLGSPHDGYDKVYAALDRLATGRPGHRLKQVLTGLEPLSAQASPVARDLVAQSLIRDLTRLKLWAPNAFEAARRDFPLDVRSLDPARVRLPRFRLRAYKREGKRAFTVRETRRMAQRRGESGSPLCSEGGEGS